jgi:hypothetical protein
VARKVTWKPSPPRLVRDRMVLRLADRDRERFLRLAGAEPFVAMGRTMCQWAMVPPALAASPARLRPWLRRALTHGRSLPAKPSRPRRPGRLHDAVDEKGVSRPRSR